MKHKPIPLNIVLAFASIIACAVVSNAQTRVFVSGLGSDANPCSRTAPCRTFQQAHNLVLSGGEIIAIDAAGYGQVTITKSVSIIGDGVYAGISVPAGFGITIATPGITVNLRSLVFDGLGTGDRAIGATDFDVLHIENCVVTGFTNTGIIVSPTTGGTREVYITKTISRNNGGAGIGLSGVSGTLFASIDATKTENNSIHGISAVGAGAVITISRCVSSQNTGNGISAFTGVVMNIESTVVSHNGGVGILSQDNSTARVSNSTATNNTSFGFLNASATFGSRGQNTVSGNNGGGAQTSGAISAIVGF